jgi:hypothetical protein
MIYFNKAAKRFDDQQDRQYTYNVILWRFRLTSWQWKQKKCIMCVVVELHVTVKHINILGAAQQCFYGKCMPLTTMQIILPDFERIALLHRLHKNAALKMNVLLRAFFRRAIWLNRS